MFENNILTGSTAEFGNIVKIYPLLIFTKENIDHVIEHLDDILTKIQKKVMS
jgi:4-aminobutyrate aminotransferase-like enzyme